MNLNPDLRFVHGLTTPTGSRRMIRSESPSSHAGVLLDWNFVQVPLSASFPGTTEQFSHPLAFVRRISYHQIRYRIIVVVVLQ